LEAAADTDTGSEGYAVVGFVPADGQTRESCSAPGDPATPVAELAGWNPQTCRLLDQVDATSTWGLYDRNPLTRWTNGRRAASLKGPAQKYRSWFLNVRFYLRTT
jgi:hypothetical protein